MGEKKTAQTPQTSPTTQSSVDPNAQSSEVSNQAAVDAAGLAGGDSSVCDPNEVQLPTPVAPAGSLSYYTTRHQDFATRYAACELTPPDYYLGYGLKYVSRFTNETAPLLSEEGQAWLARARVNLQVAIENRLGADPLAFDQLEKNNDGFRAFAYGTHADAYWAAGLGDLSLFDLTTIGLTPDVEDLVAFEGLGQVVDIGSRLLGVWGTDAIDYVAGEGTTEDIVDAAYSGLSEVGDGIDEVFGQGTAESLRSRAAELGVDAEELAEDGYEVVADIVGDGVDVVDGVFGEGTVSNTVNGLREEAQGAVEDVEAGYNTASDWVSEAWDDIF